jgi:hypothetical protein
LKPAKLGSCAEDRPLLATEGTPAASVCRIVVEFGTCGGICGLGDAVTPRTDPASNVPR